jgi:hypothetical protein
MLERSLLLFNPGHLRRWNKSSRQKLRDRLFNFSTLKANVCVRLSQIISNRVCGQVTTTNQLVKEKRKREVMKQNR